MSRRASPKANSTAARSPQGGGYLMSEYLREPYLVAFEARALFKETYAGQTGTVIDWLRRNGFRN